jgi:hypothetical protein
MQASRPRQFLRVTTAVVALVPVFAAGVADAGTPCIPQPPGAIYWLAGDRDLDDRAGFHNGSIGSAITSFVDGQVGEAIRFDGVDDQVFPDVSAAEMGEVRAGFSYEFWARPTATMPACPQSNSSNCSGVDLRWMTFPNHANIVSPQTGAGIGIGVGTNAICVGEHAPFLVDCLARLDGLDLTDWTHIAVVVEDKTPRIYVDGLLAHTGIASAREFVFASWSVIGSGLTLGRYQGDLDEVTVYARALGDEEIADIFAAGSGGKCKPDCPVQRIDDAWQGALVTSHSGLLSTDASGMFGGENASPELDSTIFRDGEPDGTVHSIEWETEAPIALAGLGAFAFHDSIASTQRAFRQIRVQARAIGGSFATVYESAVTLPYAPDSRELRRCPNLRPLRAQQFRAEFTQDGAPGFSGPRVMELDGIGLPDEVFRDGFESP